MPGLPQERPKCHCTGFRSKTVAESQSGRSFGGSRNHVPEVCECHAAVPAGSSWKQLGVTFSRTTMARWIIRCAEDWLEPLWDAMRKELLQREVLHADETVVQVLKENGKTAQSKSYMGFTVPAWMGCRPLYCTITSPDAAANIQRSSGGVLWIPAYRRLCRLQPGAGYYPLRLLGPSAPEVRGAMPAASSNPKVCSHRHRLAGITVTSCLQLKRNCWTASRRKTETAPCGGETHAQGFWCWLEELEQQPLAGNLKKAVQYAANSSPIWRTTCLTPGARFPITLLRTPSVLYCGTQELAVQRHGKRSPGQCCNLCLVETAGANVFLSGIPAHCTVQPSLHGLPPASGAAQGSDALERLHAQLF